jgi:hypothetical protein
MTCDPHVSSSDPVPVAAEPDVAWLRRHADDFHLGRRRSYGDGINRGCGDRDGTANDAACEQRCGRQYHKYYGSCRSSAFHDYQLP